MPFVIMILLFPLSLLPLFLLLPLPTKIYESVYDQTYASLGDLLNVAGQASEEASYDAEGFLSVKEIDFRSGIINKWKFS